MMDSLKHDVRIPEFTSLPCLKPLTAEEQVPWSHAKLKVNGAALENGGQDAIIAYLDTSGLVTHVDLKARALNQYSRDWTNDPSADDYNGHGTSCSGIGSAQMNGFGTRGVAHKSWIANQKVLAGSGSGSFTGIANGIRFMADSNPVDPDGNPIRVKIMSMSFGAQFQGRNAQVDAAIEYAHSKGWWMCAASGNANSFVGYPASHPLIFAIASTGKSDKRSGFSNFGDEIEFATPGENIISPWLNNSYRFLTGTSMACPAFAGVLAVILTEFPEIETREQLVEWLKENTVDLETEGYDVKTGWGMPDFQKALVDNRYGDDEPDDEPDDDEPDDIVEHDKTILLDASVSFMYVDSRSGNAMAKGLQPRTAQLELSIGYDDSGDGELIDRVSISNILQSSLDFSIGGRLFVGRKDTQYIGLPVEKIVLNKDYVSLEDVPEYIVKKLNSISTKINFEVYGVVLKVTEFGKEITI